jgi:uncharacterized cofD-like protein
VLLACRELTLRPTAVVTVADDGGSSGRLRRDLGIIALGDLRMALLALARREPLADTLAHRFERGTLQGHAVGNLFLLALVERAKGDILTALRAAERLLDCTGTVLPSTTAPVQLSANVAGRRVDGQANVTSSGGRLDAVWLEPRDAPACPEAVTALCDADAIILGPGSLFTSVIANLLVDELRQAICRSSALLVHVANVQVQPGETSQLSLEEHVELLHSALRERAMDAVIVHDGPAPEGGEALRPSAALDRDGRVVAADLLSRRADGRIGRAHDPVRLAAALETALTGQRPGTAANPQ